MTFPVLGWRMNKTYHLVSVLAALRRGERARTGHRPKVDVGIPILEK
jgi:hypothetical protein